MLKWKFEEHRWGERAVFWVNGIRAIVEDLDGDRSVWKVHRRDQVIAGGDRHDYNPYHFDSALEDAEAALRAYVGERLSAATPDEEE